MKAWRSKRGEKERRGKQRNVHVDRGEGENGRRLVHPSAPRSGATLTVIARIDALLKSLDVTGVQDL